MNTQDFKTSNVLNLYHSPISMIRIGLIGMGKRGLATLRRYMQLELENFTISALCDLDETSITKAQSILKENHKPIAKSYCSSEGWKELCQQPDVDLILICTDWASHTPMAVYAMECGKHVAIEVPASLTVSECWRLVNTAERTRMHCTMLENCCYDPFALTTLHMARQGLFGDISHVEGAYIHDLRELYFRKSEDGGFYDYWSQSYCMQHTGNLYPTHGLGPLCQILDIHHSDRMVSLVSMSSVQTGLHAYAKNTFGLDSKEAKLKFKVGDMNTTLIRTALGKTIMLQYAIGMPRPYSRIHTISGSLGFAQKYPIETLMLDDCVENTEDLIRRFEHPLVTSVGKPAGNRGIDNIMNYMMDYRLIYCLQNGLPLDISVYDVVEWSCIAELSEKSVLSGSNPVDIPNFLRS